MLRLLIADDEKVIRESLAKCLNWEEIGIQVVGCCADGLEALDCIIDESPDIVITDIKMPGLGGLELISKMQNIDREIQFIILSGYREFDLAQKAMELGVRWYLLKPVSEEQMMTAVTDAIKNSLQHHSVKAALEERSLLQSKLLQYQPLETQPDTTTGELQAEQNGNELVKKVKHYVQDRLDDSSLSLKKIASQYAHANADYLSRLFLQQTGEKFSRYLNRKRVERAKHLLEKDSSKVYLVAEQVGLGHNPRYFSQVFKKYTGLTPSAYTELQDNKQSAAPGEDERTKNQK